MKAFWAGVTADPEQRLAIADWTFVASLPQTTLRSPGVCSVFTAARRHAGGVAARMLEERVRRVKRIVDLMVSMSLRVGFLYRVVQKC
jgi:hypothetical protein